MGHGKCLVRKKGLGRSVTWEQGAAGVGYSLAMWAPFGKHVRLPEVGDEFAPAFTDIFHLFPKQSVNCAVLHEEHPVCIHFMGFTFFIF